MKYLFLIILMANMLLGIEQVPRRTSSTAEKRSELVVDSRRSGASADTQTDRIREKTVVQRSEQQRDQFIDKNSDGVNDRREDDFQDIKTKKSKHKDIIERPKTERVEPQQKEKTSAPARESTTSKKKEK
jgi:long-subunit acyl-CoA synthetase (AMP-forming)